MSGQFVVCYAGLGVRFTSEGNLVAELPMNPSEGTIFESEASGWLAAYKSELAPRHVRVRPLSDFISVRDARTLHISGGPS